MKEEVGEERQPMPTISPHILPIHIPPSDEWDRQLGNASEVARTRYCISEDNNILAREERSP